MKIFYFSKESAGGLETYFRQMKMLRPDIFDSNFYFYKKTINNVVRSGKYFYINDNYPVSQEYSNYKVILFLKNIIKSISIIRKERPKLIFASDLYAFFVCAISKVFLQKGIKFGFLVNTNYPAIISGKTNFFYRKIFIHGISKLSKHVDFFVFTSKSLSEDFSRNFGIEKRRIHIIPHAVDIELIDRLKNETLTKNEKIYFTKAKLNIISAGRMDTKQKDFENIINSFNLLNKIVKSSQLLLIGNGEKRKKLQALTKMLNISKNVKFLDWQKNIYKFFNNSDIFLFSSNFEGFGTVIIEAMAVGLPVVSTDTPYGPSEIIENGKNGYIVPMKNPAKMTEIIIRILKTKKIKLNRLKKLAMIRANGFNLNLILNKYEKLFLKIINK